MEPVPSALIKILQKCVPEKIVDCTTSSGSNPGDNVVGKMVAAKITTSSGQIHDLVVKASIPFRNEDEGGLTHEEKLFAKMVAKFGSFPTELSYYQRIKPGMDLILKESYALPTPHFYFGDDDPKNGGFSACLVLEDLRLKGFKMADKMIGLSLREVMMVLENIAKFHAASYVYLHKAIVDVHAKGDPLATHCFAKNNDNRFVKTHQKFVKQLNVECLKLAKEDNGLSEQLYQKILKWFHERDHRDEIIETSRKAAKEYFRVVIHGDLWVNNILFKYDDQDKPVDVCFIDFQQCRYASVYDELHYFIYTSTTRDFRKENLDKCLEFYYEFFMETLENLVGRESRDRVLSRFTKEKFWEGYHKYLGAAFCYGVCAIPFQVGVAPADAATDLSTAGERSSDERSSGSGKQAEVHDDEEELMQFMDTTFKGLEGELLANTKNSPVAVKRLVEFCLEMEKLGLFDK